MTTAHRQAWIHDPGVPAPDGTSADPPVATRMPVAPLVREGSRLDFLGDLDAVLALLVVRREEAGAMLPAGLRLAPQDLAPGERHPLLLVLGHQRNVRFALSSAGIDYLEFILAVPFVEHARSGAGPAGPFVYLPRLFLDRRLPTVAGRLLLAYEKRRALISATDGTYRITAAGTGEPLLSARFRMAPQAAGASPPAGLEEIFRLPVISRRRSGAWRYSVADLALDRAEIAPLAVDLEIERPFVPGLPAGSFAIDPRSGRAVRIRASWRLSGPFARRSPPRHPGLDNRGQKQ
jgi:hypothetical protein